MPRVTFTDDDYVATYISQSPEHQSSAPFAMPRPMVRAPFFFTFPPDIRDYSTLKRQALTRGTHRRQHIALPMFHPYVQQSVHLSFLISLLLTL